MSGWLLWAVGCAEADPVVLRGGRLPGGEAVDVSIRDGRIVEVGRVSADGVAERDLAGGWLVPAVIDSHVHLSYLPVGEALVRRGVVGAVDLASPEGDVGAAVEGGPRLRWSGPMITAPGGYPTTSWGIGGYGREVDGARAAEDAVRELVARGAKVIKVPLVDPQLGDAALRRVVETAHELGVPVAVHALDDAGAARGAAFGADLLAHTPVEPLAPATVQAWSGRAVISTLRAFGGSEAAVANLRALRAAGAEVLYGTDLGNTRDAGIDVVELRLLQAAGLDGAAILTATTAAPAARWGWAELGALAPGGEASLLVLDRDPLVDPLALAVPREVWIAGAPVR